MLVEQACVMLSGGMDSVAALHWAKAKYHRVIAMLCDYGQPNRDTELQVAESLANGLGVKTHREVITGLVRRGILASTIPAHKEGGVSPAVVPGRNVFLFACGAAHSTVLFPNGNVDLVVGCNKDDAVAFPDCDPGAQIKGSAYFQHAFARHITIVAPWIDWTKADVLRLFQNKQIDGMSPLAHEVALSDIVVSWSCYERQGAQPKRCGVCTACVLRASAFSAVGLTDVCEKWNLRMTGGDPARCL